MTLHTTAIWAATKRVTGHNVSETRRELLSFYLTPLLLIIRHTHRKKHNEKTKTETHLDPRTQTPLSQVSPFHIYPGIS
jgi:hypothetical protein